jgi:predicted esterase
MRTHVMCLIGGLLLAIEINGIGVETLQFLSANGKDTLALDIYRPDSASAYAGWGLFFLHGGGFSGGARNDDNSKAFAQALAQEGLTVVSMDYRLRQIGRGFHCDVPVADKREAIAWAAEDLQAAIQKLKSQFPKGIIASGSSAGAEAALYGAYHQRIEGIKAVISIAGAMEPLDSFSAIPLLSFHGTCDNLVPFCEAIHHHCPSNSDGALMLWGGGALAAMHDLVELVAFRNAGHELANSLLTENLCIETTIQFVQSIMDNRFTPSHQEIPSITPCALNHSPAFPCEF